MLSNGIVAVWINSARPMGVSVDHGWRPAGKPMLVTRAEGTVVHELDGTPALAAYLAEQGGSLERTDLEFFRKVMEQPGRPAQCARPLRRPPAARLPPRGRRHQLQHRHPGADHPPGDVDRRRRADRGRPRGGRGRGRASSTGKARLALVFSCGSRVPLLGDRIRDEVTAISSALDGAPVCGFYTFGEFARTTGSTGVHNSSVAVLAL